MTQTDRSMAPGGVSRDTVPVELIDPDPEQPRRWFDPEAIAELASSMASNGLAQPIVVRPSSGGRFSLVCGERRLRAARRLGWERIAATVTDATDEQARWLQLTENMARADLTPIEEAEAFAALAATGATHHEIAGRVGKGRSYVTQKLRLLDAPPGLRSLGAHGALSEGHLRQLLRLRKVYESAATVTRYGYDPELAEKLRQGEKVSRDTMVGFVVGCRPLDWPGVYLHIVALWCHTESPQANTMAEALRAQLAAGPITAWERVAVWYGLAAAALSLTVAELKNELNDFIAHVDSARVYRFLNEDIRGHDLTEANTDEWCGYQADLRHAGLDGWADTEARLTSIGNVSTGLLLPTVMQPGAPKDELGEHLAEVYQARHEADR